ncbi:MAG: hypothetical protein BWY72_02128 [Bacteroidetes bacterium ADurb.Bin416]|nr:MAG: hypothetical protein BWY72_02128 [Bacteroidetes bacterium ADurb.Bin416]
MASVHRCTHFRTHRVGQPDQTKEFKGKIVLVFRQTGGFDGGFSYTQHPEPG